MTRFILAIAAALLIAPATTAAEQTPAQQPTIHKPMEPIGPTSQAQCEALARDWTATCDRIYAAHDSCLKANNSSSVKGAGECDKAPCLPLHIENMNCGKLKSSAVSSCNAQVSEYRQREAAFQRAQQAAIAAQQRAEQERRQRLQEEAARFSAEAQLARQRADAYRRATPRSRPGGPGLSASQTNVVDDIRERADRLAENAREMAARAGDALSNVDLSDVRASAEELLRNEGMALLQKSLEERGWSGELIEAMNEKFELPIAIAESLPAIANGVMALRARIRGDGPEGPDWDAGLDFVERVGDISFSFSGRFPRLAPIGQVGNVVGGVRESVEFATGYLEGMKNAYLEGRPFLPAEDFASGFVTRLVSGVMPIDTIQRLNNLANDASSSWQRETKKFREMFW